VDLENQMINRARDLIDQGDYTAASRLLLAVAGLENVARRTVNVPLRLVPMRDDRPATVPGCSQLPGCRDGQHSASCEVAIAADMVERGEQEGLIAAFRGARARCAVWLVDQGQACNRPVELINTADGGRWSHSMSDLPPATHEVIPGRWDE